MKQDITELKHTAEEAVEIDNVMSENEILKAKCSELETKVNTLSRTDDDQRLRDKTNYERRIKDLSDELQRLQGKYNIKSLELES